MATAESIVRAYIEALNASTWEELKTIATPMIAPKINFQEPSAVGTVEGRDAFLEILKINKTAFPNMKWTIEQLFLDANNNAVAIRWRGLGRQEGTYVLGGQEIPATHREFDLGGFAVLTCDDTQIFKFRGHPDKFDMMMQLGVLLVPPTSKATNDG